MSIPLDCKNIEEYYSNVINFLKNYLWIYDYKNTEIVHNGVLDRIPFDLRLNSINNWPEELQLFHKDLLKLKNFSNSVSNFVPLKLPDKYPTRGLKLKKLHEVLQLGPLINQVCSKNNIQTIIDIGSGRGYLTQLLFDNYGYKVIALESKTDRVKKAQIWQQKYFPESLSGVTYKEHFVDSNSLSYLESLKISGPVCITGLHCCADLTKNIINLFKQWNEAKVLIVLPCCYHNLTQFPNSQSFKKLTIEPNLLKIPFLRIACQVGELNWSETLNKHAKNTLNRAVIEFLAKKYNYKLKRIKRLPECTDISLWVSTVSDLFENVENINELKSRLINQLEKSHKDIFKVENLLWIQALLQPLFENIVLLDFIEVLKESVFTETITDCIKVSNDLISPRCHAILATKKKRTN